MPRKYRGQPIGTVGHFACFSLQDTKHITTGDGGVVASSDERFGPLLQRYGDKGADRLKGGGFHAFATNYRMSEPQAAMLAAQLERLEGVAAKRARLGNLLTEKTTGLPGIMPHQVHPEDRCVYWFYFMRIEPNAFRCDRAQFVMALHAEDLATGYSGVLLEDALDRKYRNAAKDLIWQWFFPQRKLTHEGHQGHKGRTQNFLCLFLRALRVHHV